MLVQQARAVARQWVLEVGSQLPGFRGAFGTGSTNWLPEDAIVPATSDVDVMLAVDDPEVSGKPGKLIYRDVLLEVSTMPRASLQSPEPILGDYHLAGGLGMTKMLVDPTGDLTALQAAVAHGYAQRRWVVRRCEDARNKILRGLQGLDAAKPFHAQVTTWLFPTGVMTHVLLVAGLQNPTVRRRYLAARALLADYGHLAFYETLLELLGCGQMPQERVAQHLTALTAAFDAAKAVIRTPFPFVADISDSARPVAIDGSWELLERGDQREAIFWMVATYSRCLDVFAHDAPHLLAAFDPAFRALLADLGITSFADLQQRAEQVVATLPRLWAVAEAIMAVNPGISDA
jgi:hypothetical protein